MMIKKDCKDAWDVFGKTLCLTFLENGDHFFNFIRVGPAIVLDVG